MGNKESRSAATRDFFSSIDPERQARQPLCQSDGNSSEGSYSSVKEETPEDLLRNSWSPEGTPVSSITALNENNEEENDDDDQEQNDEHVPAPAARCNIVRLEENEEYPIKRHCFRDCTKKFFRNRKKCAMVPLTLAFIFMGIFIVCILRITEMCIQLHEDDGSYTLNLSIPVESVVDVDLISLMNNHTMHPNKIKVTVPDASSLVRVAIADNDNQQVAMADEGDQISFPLNINITLEKGQNKSILRYWNLNSGQKPEGNITLYHEHAHNVTYGYKWGSIKDPPPYGNCYDHKSDLSSTSSIIDIPTQFEDSEKKDKNIIHIHFCYDSKEDTGVNSPAIIGINVTEHYVKPKNVSYKYICTDDTDNHNSAVLPYQSLKLGRYNPSNPQLYVNTHYRNTDDDCSEMIKLKIEPDSSKDAMEIIEIVALVITAILSLLLSLMMFGIGIRCCCCHIKTGFCALGLFYEEQ
ncbi:PREDICTED: uncharacterized protein LOC109593381 [Amphimedon queenslandica]|uniref:Uncharacterized protein n=1 Tax=Amphimedon queenslandica TaxID=400682 RepID=A0A1X7VVM5_AMPQE|nr:PREDICTED: uncharacterized protein LOC109593381 [Amphimedon queenslandica]|eukprot:XP_019864056.1 PREDICTED: uncharacterized protein LOC109593381 [Amphimedon queenslandica]